MKLTRDQIQLNAFALRRARQLLTPGDWLTVRRCGETTARFKFFGFDREWLCNGQGSTGSHCIHIIRINGSPIDMGFEAVAMRARYWDEFAEAFGRENAFLPSPGDSLHKTFFDWFCRGRDVASERDGCPF